ncbi:MAG: MFS transporter [Desulfomonilaceae bacterium]|nr:MFS transporter [Desulfomonilaceae bacterium]
MADEALKRAVLIVASVSAFVTPFLAAATNVALPGIQAQFNMDAVLLAWVATSYLLSTAVFILPFGKAADIYGRKKMYVWGMAVFTAATLFAALAASSYQLLFARVLQGAGSAMIFSTSMAILTSVFPPTERGKAIGITVAMVYIGLSAGPFLGGALTYYFTWRSVFGAVVPLGILAGFLSVKYLKGEWADARGEKLDLVGSAAYGAGIVLIIHGVAGLPSTVSIWEIVIGISLFLAFCIWELRVKWPVFNLELFVTNRAFAFSSLAALVNYSATWAVTLLLSLYLQYIEGLDPRSTGLVLVVQPLIMAAFSPLAGRLSDRIEPQKVASAGMALTALGLLGLAFLKPGTSLTYIIANLLVLGLGFAFFSSPNMNAIMSSVDKRFYGIAASATASMRIIGQMFSMGIATLVLSWYVGRVEITPAQYPAFVKSVEAAFLIFALLCGLGIFASLARGKLRAESPADK